MRFTKSLMHHGVKGQQWGVRNGPPYPIEDKVLKKGTKINSVSARYFDSDQYKNNGRWMYTYRQDDEWDNKVYKGPFIKYLVSLGARWAVEHKYETIKDLKMPNRNERVAEFEDLYNDPKFGEHTKRDLEEIRKLLVDYKIGNPQELESYRKIDVNKLKTPEDYRVAYEIFNHAMEAVHAHESTKEYARRMAQKYDAMVDDNNQGIYNNAHDPIIIFRTNEALKTLSDPKAPSFVSASEVIKNYEDVRSELAKEGKLPKL